MKAGGRTPLAGIVHALTLFLILALFGRWAALVPLPALAAILVVVAYHMSEWRSFRSLLSSPKSDVIVLLLTFLLTVFVDLTVAVEFGIVSAALLFMKRMAELTQVEGVTAELREPDEESGRPEAMEIPKGVEVYEVNGPFFFGAADKLKDVLSEVSKKPKVLILRMRHVPVVDATGLHALEQLYKRCRKEGIVFLMSEVQGQPMRAIVRSRRLPLFGRRNLAKTFEHALSTAREVVEGGPDVLESTAARRARAAQR